MTLPRKLQLVSAATVGAGVFALGAWAGPHLHQAALTAPAATLPAVSAAVPAAMPATVPMGAAPDYRSIVSRFGPAVVNIKVDGTASADEDDDGNSPAEGDSPSPSGPRARHFRGPRMPQGNVPVHGLGSGFIVAADGVILTNAHVVSGATKVTVKLSDRREFTAKVLGSDPATDIAVLKIDAHDLPIVRLGNSDQLQVGDYVLAIGAPYGFDQSATSGIVSAKGRSLPGGSSVPFIQTDAAVNPGNSGGPLFDNSGNVVGINSQIYSNTGGFEGLSFAIPIKVALQVKEQIVATGHVEHARLGVAVQPLTQALAQSFQLEHPDGALVASVTPDSAAAKAGIQPGDVIVAYDGEPLQDSGELSARVGMAHPGDKVQIKLWRDKKPLSLEIKLGEATEVAKSDEADGAAHGKLGLALRALTPDERNEAGIKAGLLVVDVAGSAEAAGIQPGDVILSANGSAVHSVEELRGIVSRQKQQIALLIARGDIRIFVPVPLG